MPTDQQIKDALARLRSVISLLHGSHEHPDTVQDCGIGLCASGTVALDMVEIKLLATQKAARIALAAWREPRIGTRSVAEQVAETALMVALNDWGH